MLRWSFGQWEQVRGTRSPANTVPRDIPTMRPLSSRSYFINRTSFIPTPATIRNGRHFREGKSCKVTRLGQTPLDNGRKIRCDGLLPMALMYGDTANLEEEGGEMVDRTNKLTDEPHRRTSQTTMHCYKYLLLLPYESFLSTTISLRAGLVVSLLHIPLS